MSLRKTRRPSNEYQIQSKKSKNDTNENSYLQCCLEESGLNLKKPPEKCIAKNEIVNIIRNIKQNLQKHFDYPRNISEIMEDLKKDCEDLNVFKHYLFPNIVYTGEDRSEEFLINDSVIKILLSIPLIQSELTNYIFEKAIDLAVENKCSQWIQMILRCFSTLDSIVSTDVLSTNLINLLDITPEKVVKMEIITAIPDIIGDQEHEGIAQEMSRFLSEDHDLIPAILDCLAYLCLTEDQYSQLQQKALHILATLTKCSYFPNFVKFLLMPGCTSYNGYLESVQGLRTALGWSSSEINCQEIMTSQILTALAIRNSMISSKSIATAWIKSISLCKINTDYKPFDIIILLLLYTTTEERQRQVETLVKKHIKMNILTEELLDATFDKYSTIIKEYLSHLIELTNTLLKFKTETLIESFASHTYTLLFLKLDDCRQSIIFELLHLGLDRKQCISSMLHILNNIASRNMAILKPQSLQMLTLLDKMDDMNLNDIREITDLICGLAYSFDNSIIKDEIHMIIRKQLGSSGPSVKVKGILAGVHAIKYLMAVPLDDDVSFDVPNEVSNISMSFLSEGAPKEAAQLIELISCSTKQFPDLTAFFYDELSNIISHASYVNKRFLAWLTDAVTNDLQQNFIVSVMPDSIGEQELSMQYCFNSDSDVDGILAVNIAGLTLDCKDDVSIGILSPLFQLVSTTYLKQYDGNLSHIDALLGCSVVMPKYDIDLIEDMEDDKVSNILGCLIHCTNWFRELVNAFVIQTDAADIPRLLKRILNIEEIEKNISQILLKTKTVYKPSICVFNINKYTGEQKEKQLIKAQIAKQKTNKKVPNDDTVLPETGKTQTTQHNTTKDKVDILHDMPLRKLNINLIKLLNNDFATEPNFETELNIDMLKFILKNTNSNIDTILLSKIKKKTFLSKQDNEIYDPKKAERCAQAISEILPNLMCHLDTVIKYIENNLDESRNETGFMYTLEMTAYFMALEYIYNMLTTYFKWIGFKNQNKALLKTSLRTIAGTKEDPSKLVSLKDLLLSVAKLFQDHEKYCLQLSVGVALIDLMSALQELSNNTIVVKIVKAMASSFLSQEWKTLDGHLEKGIYFNQAMDKFIRINFIQSELTYLKTLSIQITNEIQRWKNRNDALESMKCINKSNFAILYRNLGTTLYESSKQNIDRGLTDSEHLEMWKDVATVLKYMSEMARTLENRNTLSALFKKSMPILKLFLSQGMPIIEMKFKTETDEILEILKLLQQSTRFLQSLCCHSRLTKDTALMAKVPQMRQLLETLIYKVKAALAANNCSEAFWMGNLKNKNIRGEIIVTQLSTDSDEMPEDCDEELPEDEDQNNSDGEMNTDSRSISDIV